MTFISTINRIADSIKSIADTLRDIAGERGPHFVFGIGPVSEQTQPVVFSTRYQRSIAGEVSFMLTLTDSQKCTLKISVVDKKGNPAVADDTPVWNVDNPNVLSITPSDDGLSCDIASLGPLGDALVSVSADVASTPISGTLQVAVTAGAATTIEIQAGEPSEQ